MAHDRSSSNDESPSTESPPTGDLGYVTAILADGYFDRFDVRGLFTGEPYLEGDHDFEYSSWRFAGRGSRATFYFTRPADASGLAVGVVWAGWGEQTRVRLLVNDQVLAEDHAVHGSAWDNPMRETFPIPPELLRESNSVTIEFGDNSPMMLFFKEITLKRV